MQQLIMKWCSFKVANAGKINTNFIRCGQVERGTAPQVISAIKRAVETVMEWEDFKNKLVALGSD